METKQKGKTKMYLGVKDCLLANAAITATLPNFAGYFTAFQNGLTLIQVNNEQQGFDKAGIATSKSKIKKNLMTLTIDASHKVLAYAVFTNNVVLQKEIRYTESMLKRFGETDLRDIAQGVYDRTQTNIAALNVYGITAATQTAFQAAIIAFTNAIPKTRAGIIEKRQSTKQIESAIQTTDAALKNIDLLVEIVKLTQPAFYMSYKLNRKVIDKGHSSLVLKGGITDAETGKPILAASVLIQNQVNTMALKTESFVNADLPLITVKTAMKGGFFVKKLADGYYTVTIKKNGYQDLVTNVIITRGEVTLLDVKLHKL